MKKFFSGCVVSAAGLGLLGCAGHSDDASSSTDQAFGSGGTTWQQVTCESSNYNYQTCGVNTLGGTIVSAQLVQQLSSSSCQQGQSYGFGSNYIWVNHGCRAEFQVQIQLQGNPSIQDVDCRSESGQRNYCSTSFSQIQSVRVLRPESGAACIEGQSFGSYGNSIWVDRGCEALFEVKGFGGGGPTPPPPPPGPGPQGCGTLESGQTLYQNQYVTSCDRQNMFVHVADGQIVLYHNGTALWWSGVHDSTSNTLTMQNDGNLVEYNRSGRAIWATNTSGQWGAALSVQDDCNVVLYANGRAVWSTNTYGCYAR
jgi:hypothetical protein